MNDFTLKYILSLVVVVLILVAGVLVQNWWDNRAK